MSVKWQDYIEERKDVMLGKPVFKGTRITVQLDGGQDAGNFVHRRHPDAQSSQRNFLAHVREHGSESLPP
jgi:hypothetical protein